MVLTIIFWGVTPILEKAGLKSVDPFTGLFIRSCAVFGILATIFISSGRLKLVGKVPPKIIILFILSGISAGLLGMWSYYKVLKVNPASKIVPLTAAYPLFAAFLSVIILKENVTLARIIGTVLIIAGSLLVVKL